MVSVVEAIGNACEAEGYSHPSRAAVIRRCRQIPEREIVARRQGPKAAEQHTPRPGRYEVKHPWDVWQIDHTPTDVIIIDREGRPIGRPWLAYIRRSWTHPLAVFCAQHGVPLLLDTGERRLEHRLRFRWAVRDVVDALAANRRAPLSGALASLLEQPLFGRKSLQGSNRLQLDWLSDIDAATRLLYVRLALLVLAEPPDPAEAAKEPLGRSWLLTRYRHSKIAGWQSVFSHAIRDPLFLLATELPRMAVLELNERSRGWPADLRRRWTYAAAAGAVGGYVF